MFEQTNGHNQHPVVAISIQMLPSGQVALDVKGADVNAVFFALGEAVKLVAAQAAKGQQQQIEVAPPGLINRLPKG